MFLFNIQSLCKIIYLSKTCFHGGILVQLTWFSRYMKVESRFFIRDLKDIVNTYIYKSRYNISRSFMASKLTSSFWIHDITFYQDCYLKNSLIFVLSGFFSPRNSDKTANWKSATILAWYDVYLVSTQLVWHRCCFFLL